MAQVNGEKILASELFERACSSPLGPSQLSLIDAAKELKADTLRVDEHRELKEIAYRKLQELAIRQYLNDFIKTRLLTQALLNSLDKEQTRQAEAAVSKMFDEYVEKLKQDLHVSSLEQVDAKLHDQGTSLEHVRQEFRRRLLADEYLRKTAKDQSHQPRCHRDVLPKSPERLPPPRTGAWQLLEISFERHGGREEALALAQKAAAELRRGKPFASVTRKYVDDVPAEEERVFTRRTVAGPLPRPQADWWTQINSSNDQELADAIHQIAAGEDVKQVFNRPEWGHVVAAQPSGSPALLDNTTQVPAASAGVSEARSVQLQRTPLRYRRVRLHSRYDKELNIVNRPGPNRMPREQVTIVTGGGNPVA